MNKIYKVIWSKVRNCYVVVSEMAKRNGKCSSSLNKKIIASFLAAGLVAAIIPKDAEAWYIMANNSTIVIAGQGPVYNRVGGSGDRLGTVWGSNTSAEAAWATAFGSNTVASSTNATAWGNGARATGNHATAFGGGTEASNYRATAWGNSTIASGSDSTAWGTETQATKTNATAFGSGTVAASDAATAWGRKAQATGQYSTAWGFDTSATAQNATAFGQETQATANRATAFGIETTASGKNSTSFGYKTQAVGENSTAWGSNTQAVGGGATAFGAYTEARAENSVTWGNHSIVFGGEVTVGGQKYTDLETLRYNGTNQYYLTGKDENGNIVRLGGIDGDTEIIADGFIYTTGAADAWEGNDEEGRGKVDDWIISPAGGKGEVAGQYSTAFGERSRVHARNALGALGGTVQAGAHNSAAIGVGSDVSSEDSYAMGNGATIETGSAGSVALGTQTFIGGGATNSFAAVGGAVGASATSAVAIGQGSSAQNVNAIALGKGAAAIFEDSVALGSSTTTQAGVGATKPNAGTAIGGATYGSHAWANTLADTNINKVVSVGNRQINQLAAGQVSASSTDAINGSQLYAAYQDLQWKASVSANGGKVSSYVAQQVIGDYIYSGNKGVVNFKAGRGIEIETANSGSLDMTFKANLQQGTNMEIVEGTDGGLKLNAYDTKVQAGSGLKMVTNGDMIDAENVRTYKLDLSDENQTKINNALSSLTTAADGTTAQTLDKSNTQANFITGKNMTLTGSSSGITVATKDSVTFTDVTAGTGASQVVIGSSGVQVGGNTYITGSGLNANNHKITNVAAGVSDSDAVNLAQLNNLQWKVGIDKNGGTNNGGALGQSYVGKDKSNVQFIAGKGIDISSAPITDGYGIKVSSNTKIYQTNDTTVITFGGEDYTIAAGKGGSIGTDTNTITSLTTEGGQVPDVELGAYTGGNIQVKGHRSVHGDLDIYEYDIKLNKDIDLSSSGSLKIGNSAINNTGVTATNVTATTVKAGSSVMNNDGVTTTNVTATNNVTAKNVMATNVTATTMTAGNSTMDTNGFANGDTKVTSTGLTIAGGPAVTKTNVTMGGQQIHEVAPGTAGTDAVNVNQLNNLKWNIGISKDGGTNKDGALALSPVGKTDKEDRSNIQFVAGKGIDISKSYVDNGYGVTVSSKFQALSPTVEGGRFIDTITYDGHEYLIAGGGAAGSVDVISDKRSTVAELVDQENKHEDGSITTGHAIKVFTPFIEVQGTANATKADFSNATGDYAIALGQHAEAAAENTIAMGHHADAKSEASTAIGYNSHAHGPGSVSIGVAATTSGNRAIAIGTTARNVEDVNYETSNPHQGARAAGQGSIVLGDRARALTETYRANDKLIGTPDYEVNDAIAIGTRSNVSARNGIAMGSDLSYSYTDPTTGKLMTIYGADKDTLGGREMGAVVGDSAYSGIAIGGAYGTVDTTKNQIHMEMGAAATYGERGIAIGTGALVANKEDFSALEDMLNSGDYIEKKHAFETARSAHLAAKAKWEAVENITPNDPSMPASMQITESYKNEAKARYESTKKTMETATQAYSLALKEVVRIQSEDSAKESDAIAIGTQATAQIKDSIALGSKSLTTAQDKAGSRTGLSGYDPLQTDTDNDYFRGDAKYAEDDPVWRSTAGSLSVGGGTTTVTDDEGKPKEVTVTRRISNVAAGIDDSDAVNVAQLKRATKISTDNRNTALGYDENGNMIVNSPYLNINGVEASSEYNSIIRKYKDNGGAEGYKKELEEDTKEIQGRIDSINTTRDLINKNLEELKKKHDAQTISEQEYTAQTLEYNDQLAATELRLNDLAASLAETKEKMNNAEAVYKEAKAYYDSQSNASGTDSIAIGNKAASGGKDSITIGQGNQIGTVGELDKPADANLEKEGARSIAIGTNNKITGTKNAESSTDSIAIGSNNTVTGNQSIAVGTGNQVLGSRSGAIGDPNYIAAGVTGTYILGNDNGTDTNKIATNDTFIIGSNVRTTAANSVFLGKDTAYVAAGNRTAGLRTDYTGDTFNGQTYNYAGGDQTVGVVSVGSETETRRIQNVAPGLIGPESTDAINGSQLYSAINNTANNLGNQITNIDSRARKGVAGAAALAALHPLEFDPDDKLTFAAGVGNYRGETAAAIGAFYRADEKVMFSIGGSMGNGENVVNAGVSFSLDRTPRQTSSRTAMAREIVELREQVAQLTAIVNQLAGGQLPKPPVMFPNTPENAWAYEYLENLQKKGNIVGYTGRELTRNEFAAALDRAMMSGAKLDERLIKEFEPELSHVRVSHVAGKGEDEGGWYERPRTSHDKLENQHEIAKKPLRPQEKSVTSKS